jgi:hypothetical protein
MGRTAAAGKAGGGHGLNFSELPRFTFASSFC